MKLEKLPRENLDALAFTVYGTGFAFIISLSILGIPQSFPLFLIQSYLVILIALFVIHRWSKQHFTSDSS